MWIVHVIKHRYTVIVMDRKIIVDGKKRFFSRWLISNHSTTNSKWYETVIVTHLQSRSRVSMAFKIIWNFVSHLQSRSRVSMEFKRTLDVSFNNLQQSLTFGIFWHRHSNGKLYLSSSSTAHRVLWMRNFCSLDHNRSAFASRPACRTNASESKAMYLNWQHIALKTSKRLYPCLVSNLTTKLSSLEAKSST